MRKLGARYVLHELLGQGTAGQVWRGAHVPDGEPVAIKVLRPELAHDPEIVDRFLREWDLLVELDSPDLVRVRDLIREPDTPLAIVMDLVEGIDLRAHLDQSGPRPVTEAVNLVVGLLWALDSVHAAGIIHRDVKPENVLIDTSDPRRPYVRLTDFGVARMVHTPTRASLTGPIGTPLYMAPELTTDAPPTPSVDIYAAGVVLYELIAGSPPFDEAHPADMVRAHREDQPLPIQGVPPALWDVLSAMLAKSPRQRPPSAADAAEDLIEALGNDRDRDDPDFDSDDQLDLDNRRPEDRRSDERDRGFDDRSTDQRGRESGRGRGDGRGAVPDPRRDAAGNREAAFDAAQTRIGNAADWADDERGRQPATAGRRLAGAGAAIAATSVAGAGVGGPAGDWNDAEHTQIAGMPPVRPDWNDAEHTQIAGMPPVRADWSDDDTGGRPAVRVPARSTGSASDRNTVISAIPANKQPAPGSSGSSGGPGGRTAADRRRRSRIAAGAGLVVALVAGAGGWALAAAGDSEGTLTADNGAQVITDPSVTATLPGGAPMPAGMDPATIPTSTAAGASPRPGTTPSPGQSVAPGATPTQPGQTSAPPATATATATPKDGTVPNVEGQSQAAATNTLSGKGFTNVATTEVCQKGKNGGTVIDQAPNAGSVVPVTTKVTLTVQATNCVEVPAVAGQSLAAARGTLTGVGLGVLDGNGGCQYGAGANAARTTPAAGSLMHKGDSVWLEPTCKDAPAPPPARPPPPHPRPARPPSAALTPTGARDPGPVPPTEGPSVTHARAFPCNHPSPTRSPSPRGRRLGDGGWARLRPARSPGGTSSQITRQGRFAGHPAGPGDVVSPVAPLGRFAPLGQGVQSAGRDDDEDLEPQVRADDAGRDAACGGIAERGAGAGRGKLAGSGIGAGATALCPGAAGPPRGPSSAPEPAGSAGGSGRSDRLRMLRGSGIGTGIGAGSAVPAAVAVGEAAHRSTSTMISPFSEDIRSRPPCTSTSRRTT